MTALEKEFLFKAIYMSISGLFLICTLAWSLYQAKKNSGQGGEYLIIFLAVFLAKCVNTYYFLEFWGGFLNPLSRS